MTNPNIADYRSINWIRTGVNEVTLLTNPFQVLEKLDFFWSFETENHLIVPFIVGQNEEAADACILAKNTLCFEHDSLISWIDSNLNYEFTSPNAIDLYFENKTFVSWIRTKHDKLYYTFSIHVPSGLWEIEDTYDEDCIDFDQKVVVDNIVIFDNGLIMLFSIDAEVKQQVVTNIGWRSKTNLVFEPYQELEAVPS